MAGLRHFLIDDDLSATEQVAVLDIADRMKRDRTADRPQRQGLDEALHNDRVTPNGDIADVGRRRFVVRPPVVIRARLADLVNRFRPC